MTPAVGKNIVLTALCECASVRSLIVDSIDGLYQTDRSSLQDKSTQVSQTTQTHIHTQAGALTRLESKHGGEVSACVETIWNLKCQIPTDAVPACAGWVRFPHHLNLAHQRAHSTCRLSGKKTNPGKHHDFRLAKLKRTWHFHPNNTNNLGFDGSSRAHHLHHPSPIQCYGAVMLAVHPLLGRRQAVKPMSHPTVQLQFSVSFLSIVHVSRHERAALKPCKAANIPAIPAFNPRAVSFFLTIQDCLQRYTNEPNTDRHFDTHHPLTGCCMHITHCMSCHIATITQAWSEEHKKEVRGSTQNQTSQLSSSEMCLNKHRLPSWWMMTSGTDYGQISLLSKTINAINLYYY